MADTNDGFCVVRDKKHRKVRKPVKNNISINNKSVPDADYFDLLNFKKRLDCCIQEICMSQYFPTSYDRILAAISVLIQEKTTSGRQESSCDYVNQSQSCQTPDTRDLSCPKLRVYESSQHNPPVLLNSKTLSQDVSLLNSAELLSISTDDKQDVHLLSYGIGSFISCLTARYQLAYLLAVRDKLGERCTQCCIYDPVFSDHEKLVLGLYNCQVMADNELSPYLTEVSLVNTFVYKDVFNDLSIHYCSRSQLSAALQCFGGSFDEPVYELDDAEFIGKQKSLSDTS